MSTLNLLGAGKRALLEEQGQAKCLIQEDVLVDPDDPMALEEMIEETCDNGDDNNEFFNHHNNDGDENEDEEGQDQDYGEESCITQSKVPNPPRRKPFRPGQSSKTYSCSVQGCHKTYTALHHLKASAIIFVETFWRQYLINKQHYFATKSFPFI